MLTVILIWQCVKIAKLTYTIIDPFILQAWVSIYSAQNCQFKMPPTAFFEQTTKYNVCQ